ncbi:hypothetical protein LXL04_028454 [Taraxacum kok-saghyz]
MTNEKRWSNAKHDTFFDIPSGCYVWSISTRGNNLVEQLTKTLPTSKSAAISLFYLASSSLLPHCFTTSIWLHDIHLLRV